MENTKENRLKFYAQHLGQNMIIDSDCFRSENGNDIIHTTLVSVSLKGIECDGWIPVTEHTALELKPISLITAEDVQELGWSDIDSFKKYYNSKKDKGCLFAVDIDGLRQLGFATSWNGLSVRKLQEYGWIKLKSE
ncbi:hypothetical protein AB670_00027 [Chryseobacterium sp. MOF25P]|uniref:hypothetical protein n=1 Tax=unclassified Chryseobacterium TaxID=2593645 RepID=UPI000805C01D|nr:MULTISPECIES: hypothetical protein [unclassified Chryseobacterium]OBW43498.1 hypothetical protein AB670_00027 [Chryseobacterium sp. MOF25P]OBW46728.1 hypothetical protein AB671_01224 [Chryseobacterium sp. BGARF1]